jgi:hypothetical protein
MGAVPLHVTLGDGNAASGVTRDHSPYELVVRRIEKTKLDRYAE